ncbi:hypothetical protein GOBAR_AA27972 [Gossypium barbadense]|uniref:Uncharacterized protein n=1 Tax=Gossypium barbadense TaxID=3634 RepID=A0A2P5WNN2_GOSBA|nr:hypothetical protein GOBAR_AA27972 [Gossypium barbadense]
MPYSAVNIATLIPQRVHAEARMWSINTPVLNFSTVEWYNGARWYMNRWRVYLYGGQLMIVPGHGYRRGNQPMVEVEDQHMAKPDSEDQVLNTSEQWVDTFCDKSQSSSYNLDIGGASSYHPDMGGSSSYHSDIGGSSPFDLE